MKPILFNGEMVNAILAGRKTQTRRLCKITINGNEPVEHGICAEVIYPEKNKYGVCADFYRGQSIYAYCGAAKPAYETGDILYVRETFKTIRAWSGSEGSGCEIVYAAGGSKVFDKVVSLPKSNDAWTPSIHMPKEVARIFLRVTDVRIERLQNISGRDVLSEGVDNGASNPSMRVRWENMQRMAFSELWDSTIKPMDKHRYGWAANPWVWVYTFERTTCEEATK